MSHFLLWFLFTCIFQTKGQRQIDEYFVHFIQRCFMTNGLNMTGFLRIYLFIFLKTPNMSKQSRNIKMDIIM